MQRLLVSFVAFLAAASLVAQVNTTPATAAWVQWGQKVWSSVNGNTSQFWFRMRVETPRSYCVETGQPESDTFGDKDADTQLVVTLADGVTPIASNDESTVFEPKAQRLSRVCWIAPAGNTSNLVRLNAFTGVPSQIITLRFIETTLFCPWFFVAGDYNAFSLLRNTSNTDLNGVAVTWRGLNGAVAGTTSVFVPANGGVVLNARDFVDPLVFSNGTIEIAYPGAPDQIKGSTTTLSGTTGLGFDALFEQRKTW